MLSHVEYRRSFARVIDDVVIDIVIVDDVRYIAAALGLTLNSLLSRVKI